jgi:hypothetical protein
VKPLTTLDYFLTVVFKLGYVGEGKARAMPPNLTSIADVKNLMENYYNEPS